MNVVVLPPTVVRVRAEPRVSRMTARVEPRIRPLTVRTTGAYVLQSGTGGGGTTAFRHAQTTPASEWSVPLPWGVEPASVQIKNADGHIVLADIVEASAVRVVALFAQPTTGTLTALRG